MRDLARAHVLALTVPEAGDERLIIRGGSYVWQQFGEYSFEDMRETTWTQISHDRIFRAVDAARRYAEQIPPGNPSYSIEDAVFLSRYSADKSKKVLGLEYRRLEEMTKDIVDDLRSRGWL